MRQTCRTFFSSPDHSASLLSNDVRNVTKKFLTTSESLLERASSGEDLAWSEVANTYYHMIYSWSRKRGLTPFDADHMALDVIREAWRLLPRFQRRGKGSFRKWLKAIFQHLINSYFWSHRSVSLIEPELIPDRDDDFDDDLLLLYERVSQVIQSEFSPLYCQVMWQVTHDGMSRAEVARLHGISENLVSVIKGRIRRRVQELLADEYED